jgi:hypothetical protein
VSEFTSVLAKELESLAKLGALAALTTEANTDEWYSASLFRIARYGQAGTLAAFEKHQRLMQAWNPKLNLTRVVSDSESAKKHFLESLVAGLLIRDDEQCILDLGSGAGFPGIPIGFAHPEKQVYLLESDVRKAAFLKEVTRGWANMRVLNLRSEKFASRYVNQVQVEPARLAAGSPEGAPASEFPLRIDCIISRAVHWKDLSDLARQLGCPLIWITSEEEFGRWKSSTWNVEQLLKLPNEAGVVVRMFHMEHQSRMVG